ncbi:Na/Pi symporter [Aquibacillus salsiterrae]|uniref:Na/Pi symporter n=1 Tax=Aquibacillus salsiterrae TaxID=2950439 RepID=A0A9X3WAI0_9BACI|nr:Na/Pi symporter [Aquibacillus salsiterrae]MDC3415565.1 Na/Pi symporter [Aquibacillus salsiterrae]
MADLLSLLAVFLMLFFMGMVILRTGLYQISYEKTKYFLENFTNNIFLGILTGLVATAILQSSSLVTVLTISFVSLGVLSFKNSIGVVLGANIGTTVTGELLAFSDILPETAFIIIGAFLLFINHRVAFSLGAILVGLGSIFVALNGFSSLAQPLAQLPLLKEAFNYSSQNPYSGVLIGIVISSLIQSSSATIGITMSFLDEEVLTLASSIAIVLGANIGTCITALLAGLGTSKEAKLVAFAHIWFNIIGVLIFLPFLTSLTDLTQLLSTNLKEQLAHFSVLFNVAAVIIFLPFISYFQRFIERVYYNPLKG